MHLARQRIADQDQLERYRVGDPAPQFGKNAQQADPVLVPGVAANVQHEGCVGIQSKRAQPWVCLLAAHLMEVEIQTVVDDRAGRGRYASEVDQRVTRRFGHAYDAARTCEAAMDEA